MTAFVGRLVFDQAMVIDFQFEAESRDAAKVHLESIIKSSLALTENAITLIGLDEGTYTIATSQIKYIRLFTSEEYEAFTTVSLGFLTR